jgi:hypothetical protein
MTEEQGEHAHQLYQKLWSSIHDLVDETVAATDPIVEDAVRCRLCDEFRFWRRPSKEST